MFLAIRTMKAVPNSGVSRLRPGTAESAGLLPAQAMQVERGVGGGVAARELLAKPPLKRRERGRSPALDR